ncbi:tyrosine-protein phosphatase non-receptor type 23 isoform X2 [Pieris brassicae]|uniref:tyrosine-protein phosphatase non-receptor type 23 isoform X2 n=1 Tax=Pieris brassicae TaxID=7116 RepID=UPI001E65EC80|nr:tyrosine-protein phosphatase non-receptor type 23 isoform X2 [Pieris brassicae]
MEAVPKLAFISFELKISPESTHFGPRLKQYIAEVYREDPESYAAEMHQLEGMRSAAVRPTVDSAGLKALNRYFCQLRAMQSRFPMAKGQPAACMFVWKDLYANMNLSLADLRFEMACILYNIGALHTQLASSETRTSADSLKLACQHFQNAAWAFQYLREQYPQPSGADVSSEILKLLQEICFAQAQECILDKSRQDTRKPSVIGAVATQVLHFYKNSMAILGPSTGTDNIHEIIGTKLYNNWYRHLSFKASYIGCIVSLYQGISAEEQQKMGERVACYQLAVDKLNEARKLAKYIEPVQVTQEGLTFTNDIVEGKRKAAKNENEFIYHEEVPDKDMLTEIKPVCLVKAVAIDFNDPEVAGNDVFARLVPLGAHEAASLYSERKAQLLRQVGAQADAKDLELTEFLSSLQLDQLDRLDDDDQKIPQEVVDRCAAMNANTDMIDTLAGSMNALAELITDVEHALADVEAVIQEENEAEKRYQKAMGARPPSLVQTELARELHKYREAHARTADSNAVLHKAMTLHIANLQLLARPLPELLGALPGVARLPGPDRDAMREMRRVLAKAHDMRAQRHALLDELRVALAADDVTPRLLADPASDRDRLFDLEIEKHTPEVKIIEQNLAAQENIINRLTSLYAAYGDSRRLLADVLRKRDAMLNGLVTSYDSFGELVNKSTKGLEFYRKLQHNLTALLARARSVCQVQREERAQLGEAAPVPVAAAVAAAPAPSAAPKLKDYLPYMKNRTSARTVPPQGPSQPQPASSPDFFCPPAVRPAPLGSEATDVGLLGGLSDGVSSGAYAQCPPPYAPSEVDAYPYKYGNPPDGPDDVQNYDFYGSRQQFSVPAPEMIYRPFAPAGPTPSVDATFDLSADVARMHVGGEYAQTYFSVQYPASSCDVATYSRAAQDIHTSSTAHAPHALNYPYARVERPDPFAAPGAPPTSSSAYSTVSVPVPLAFQSYAVPPEAGANVLFYDSNSFTAGDRTPRLADGSDPNLNVNLSVSSGFAPGARGSEARTPGPYDVPSSAVDPALARLDELDRPIRSHAKGEALSVGPMPMPSYVTLDYVPDPISQTPNAAAGQGYAAQYGQSYQNHPGYTYNVATGNYDYSYGSQNSYFACERPADLEPQTDAANARRETGGVYTSAGHYDTVQSPAETPQETAPEPARSFRDPVPPVDAQLAPAPQAAAGESASEPLPPSAPAEGGEPSAFDLLSDIDFSVDRKPLTPEINVPRVSEIARILKPAMAPRVAPSPAPEEEEEEPTTPPAEGNVFSDPGSVNRFTQEVKHLQNLVDFLSNGTSPGDGSTSFGADWRRVLDVCEAQKREDAKRSKGTSTDRSPDSRLTLRSDLDARYYKQLAPRAIPLVICKPPDDANVDTFWRTMFEKKIGCVVCCQSETETETQSAIYLTSAGDVTVTPEPPRPTAYWSERRLRLRVSPHTRERALTLLRPHAASGGTPGSARVALCDAALRASGPGGVCLLCDGGGQGASTALLLAVVCQVRAGRVELADTLSTGMESLSRGGGTAGDPVDLLRSVLFYARGVLHSGSTAFKGEAAAAPAPRPTAHRNRFSRESFEEMRQAAGLKSGDMTDPLNFLDPLWTLKKK